MTESPKAKEELVIPEAAIPKSSNSVAVAGKDADLSVLLSFLGVRDGAPMPQGGPVPPAESAAVTPSRSGGSAGEDSPLRAGGTVTKDDSRVSVAAEPEKGATEYHYVPLDGYLPYDYPASNDLNLFAHTAELFEGLPPPSATSSYYPRHEDDALRHPGYNHVGQVGVVVTGVGKGGPPWFPGAAELPELPGGGQSWGEVAWQADEANGPMRPGRRQHWDHDGTQYTEPVGVGYYDRLGFYHDPQGHHTSKYDYHMEKMSNAGGDIVRRLANWYSQGVEDVAWPPYSPQTGPIVREAGWHPGSVPRSDFEDWGRRQRGGDGRLARGHDVARDDWLGLLNQPHPSPSKPVQRDDPPEELGPGDVNPLDFEVPLHSKFFIIKSFNMADVRQALKHSVWASTEHGNHRLQTAYDTGAEVFLFFSVNGSGFFCGMARMASPVDKVKKCDLWSDDRWGGSFRIRWVFLRDVPNKRVHHLRVGSKSVTRSRDAQEMLPDQGRQMVQAFIEHRGRSTLLEPETEAPPSPDNPRSATEGPN
eukprot:EG_transcript_7363